MLFATSVVALGNGAGVGGCSEEVVKVKRGHEVTDLTG